LISKCTGGKATFAKQHNSRNNQVLFQDLPRIWSKPIFYVKIAISRSHLQKLHLFSGILTPSSIQIAKMGILTSEHLHNLITENREEDESLLPEGFDYCHLSHLQVR